MAERNKHGLAKAWANHPWAVAIGGALLSIPASLIVVYLTREEDAPSREPAVTSPSDVAEETRQVPVPDGSQKPTDSPSPRETVSASPPSPAPSETADLATAVPVERPAQTDIARAQVPSEVVLEPAVPRLRQTGCPVRQAALSFKLEEETNAFVSLSGVELVTLHDCEQGQFSTRFERESGALDGLGGAWTTREIRMQFGYRSNNGWGDIVCTVIAEAVSAGRYAGNISCNAAGRRGTAKGSAPVSVGL